MQEFPHQYSVVAIGEVEGEVTPESERLSSVLTAPPAEFGGPGDRWSPEMLLVVAVADCFVLTFRAIARASKFSWLSLRCDVEGTLERIDRVTQFVGLLVRASMGLPAVAEEEQARRLLARAEQSCLITNFLKGGSHLEAEVEFGAA